MLKVLQWNIRSIFSNFNDLKILIQDIEPDVICLNETFLNFNSIISISNYTILRIDRQDGYGGLAFAVKNCIPYRNINFFDIDLPQNFQIACISIGELSLINVYVPPDIVLTDKHISEISPYLLDPFILLGDFNAQSPAWGSGRRNCNGLAVEEFLRDSNVTLLNDGTPTGLTPPSDNLSAPDLTICSTYLALRCDWSVHQDTGGSDHFPISIVVEHPSASRLEQKHFSTRRFNTKRANWNHYGCSVLEYMNTRPINNSSDFIDMMDAAARQSIPL
ncbi:hypothetical protein HHI36_023741 [Cryptolaemus montrouzieri]|uniref:Endonuclease/exonuclease/phosphatase domain-containing protein n=1 Tax=Cryptolaemus montrouzieri TaxID=559131 RepID=A0ABD2PHF4_9CUCU